MRRGFTLMELLMGMALLGLILVTALGVLQWALVGSARQQSQTRAAFDQFPACANPASLQACCRSHAASSATLPAQYRGASASSAWRGCAP